MKDFGFDHPPKTQEEALVQGFCLFFTAPSKAHAQKVIGLITLILADPAVTQDMIQTSFEKAFHILSLEHMFNLKNTPKDHP